MAIQFASYDDNNMELGKFYLVEVNKDNISNLREVTSITNSIEQNKIDIQDLKDSIGHIPKLYFSDMRYIEIQNNEDRAFNVWELLTENNIEYSSLANHRLEVYKREQGDIITIILKTDRPIERGYIQFY